MLRSQPFLDDLDGRTRAVTLVPVAGADFVFQTPDGFFWDFLSIDAKLVTSAAAANRTPLFTFDDGANPSWRGQPAAAQVAATTIDYLLGEGLTRDATVAAQVYIPTPNEMRLFAGWRVFATTANLQAGDQWAATMLIREYQTNPITGPRATPRYTTGGSTRFGSLFRRPGRAY